MNREKEIFISASEMNEPDRLFRSIYGKKKMFSISNLEWMKMVFRGKIGVINSVFHVSNAAYRTYNLSECHSINHQLFNVRRKMRFKLLVNCMLINISNSYNEKKIVVCEFRTFELRWETVEVSFLIEALGPCLD